MAFDLYELIPKLERLKLLCLENGIVLDPDMGRRVLYLGQTYSVLSSRDNTLALIDDLPSIPFDPSRILYIEDWEREDTCLFIPRVDDLLQIIRDKTAVFPSMTPGVKLTREVWQVRHTSGATVVSDSLLEGLVDLAIEILQGK